MVSDIDLESAIEFGYADDVIIKDETDELTEIIQGTHKRKSEIILQAAKKLEEKYPDTHVIASRITKIWNKLDIHPDTIHKALPEKYKRVYTKPDPIKPTELQAIFYEIQTVFSQAAKLYGVYASKIENDPKLKEIVLKELETYHFHAASIREVVKEVVDQFQNILDFKSWYSFIQQLGIECEAIERLMDERQKFPMAWKFNLKILMVVRSYNHLATLLIDNKKNGAKWLSKIDSNKDIDKLFKAAYSCPKCDFDGRQYYEELKIALEKDLPIPKIGSRKGRGVIVLKSKQKKPEGKGMPIPQARLNQIFDRHD